MTYPVEIPSYVQGYRFSDENEIYYDAANKTFKDLAGYGPRADLRITTGTPVFANVNSRRCVTLDNTFHGVCSNPIPWMGTCVMVMQPVYVSGGTLVRNIFIAGDSAPANVSNDGRMIILHFSGQRNVEIWTPGGALRTAVFRSDNNAVTVALSTNQETRMAYATYDGSTIVSNGPAAGTTNGNACGIWSAQYGLRFGDLDADPSNTTAITDFYLNIFEAHFFAEDIINDYSSKTQAMMARLKAKYGTS